MIPNFKDYEDIVNNFFSKYSKFEKSKCFMCGDSETITLFHKDPNMVIKRCACGLIFNSNQPTQDSLNHFYESSDAMSKWSDIKKTKSEDTRQREKFSKAITFIKSKPEIKNILDFGCGNGFFLKLLTDLPEATLRGVEPNEHARQVAIRETKCNIALSLDEIPNNSQDFISLWGVLEHLKSPFPVLEKIRNKIRNGGYVLACVPNANSFIFKAAQEKCASYCPQHLWYFNLSTLLGVFHQAGLNHALHYFTDEEIDPVFRYFTTANPYKRDIPAWLESDIIDTRQSMDQILVSQELTNYKVVMIGKKN